MRRCSLPAGVRAAVTLVVASLLATACSSWNTGSEKEGGAERACLDTCEALARAAERCGLEYKRLYDQALRDVANGDCKNVSGVRDETLLRKVCIPALETELCTKVVAGDHDPSCSKQLQRTASLTPTLSP